MWIIVATDIRKKRDRFGGVLHIVLHPTIYLLLT